MCVPSHCEVLRLKGAGPIPSTPNLRLVVVGRATLKPDAPIAPFVLPAPRTEMVAQAVRYHTPQPSPIVIANGIAGLSRTKELETFYRSYAWFVPVRSGDVHPWTVDAFSARVQQVTARLEASPEAFQVTAPTDTLAAAASSSTAAARRLLLLGGEGGALLLAFTVLAAAALRRDVERRPPAPAVVRRAALAGRAVHAGGGGCARRRSARSSAGSPEAPSPRWSRRRPARPPGRSSSTRCSRPAA